MEYTMGTSGFRWYRYSSGTLGDLKTNGTPSASYLSLFSWQSVFRMGPMQSLGSWQVYYAFSRTMTETSIPIQLLEIAINHYIVPR